jgi:hypothetical protein
MKHEPTIEERLAELYAEMDVIVAKYVDEKAAVCHGVPRASVENSILGRAHGCACEEYKLIQAKLEAERKLADAALHEG